MVCLICGGKTKPYEDGDKAGQVCTMCGNADLEEKVSEPPQGLSLARDITSIAKRFSEENPPVDQNEMNNEMPPDEWAGILETGKPRHRQTE